MNIAKQRTKQSNSEQPVICIIDAPLMVKDGILFEHSQTYAEYTIDNVPSKYILQVAIESEDDLRMLTTGIEEVIRNLN